MKRSPRLLALTLSIVLAAPAIAHESPVDHVSRELRLWFEGGRIHLSYRLLLTERAVLLQMHAMDSNHDGKISDDERSTFFTAAATDLAGRFRIKIGDQDLALRPDGEVTLDPALGQTFTFVTTGEPLTLPPGDHAGELRDLHSRAYPGPYRFIADASRTVTILEDPTLDEVHPGMLTVQFELKISPPKK